jgi:hypothetical protein
MLSACRCYASLRMDRNKLRVWFARVGVAGFLFFLIKGLIWVVVAIVAAKQC